MPALFVSLVLRSTLLVRHSSIFCLYKLPFKSANVGVLLLAICSKMKNTNSSYYYVNGTSSIIILVY